MTVSVWDCWCFQKEDEKLDTCRMLPLTEACMSVTDVVSLLLSMAHVMAADWQSALTHSQHICSTDFQPFSNYLKGNCVVYTDIAKFAGHLPRRYGNSRAIWDHTVLPATRQRWHSHLYPSTAGTRFSNPRGMQGSVDLAGWRWSSIQVLTGPNVG